MTVLVICPVSFKLKLSMLNKNILIRINTKFYPESLLQYLYRLDDKYFKKLQHNICKNYENIFVYRFASDSNIFQYKPWLVKFAIVIVFMTSDHNFKNAIKTLFNNTPSGKLWIDLLSRAYYTQSTEKYSQERNSTLHKK